MSGVRRRPNPSDRVGMFGIFVVGAARASFRHKYLRQSMMIFGSTSSAGG
jgi:hypothetical protein